MATASVAAADVTFAGYGAFGIYNDDAASEQGLLNRFQINATGTATADNGMEVSIFSRLRVDNGVGFSATGERADGFNAPQITVKNGALTVQMGNTASAAGARTNVFGSATGSLGWWGLYDTSSTWYSSTGAANMDRVRVDYTMGSTTVSVSGDVSGDERLEAGASMTLGSVNVGVAAGDDDYYAADLNAALGDVTVGARLTNTISGAYANYTQGAFSINAYASDDDDYGMGAAYDLGGTVSANFEYNKSGDFMAYMAFNF